ncbi:hypothetical protein DFH09DRAFT_1125248 [Mycena vulgaris]|nr:hypothetical protein DFH09DRAFT_1125248 [Mycena vulgaris]
MSFTHKIRLGGAYYLDTYIRFRPPFKMRVMKLTKQAPALSGEKTLGAGKSQVSAPSPLKGSKKANDVRVVRRGEVCVKECGVHPRCWFRNDKWLALSETQLTMYSSETEDPRSHILLSDIAQLERTDVVPYGLALKTKDERRYLMTFQNDADLYGWQDDIASRSMGVGLPYNFVHEAHASVDPVNGGFTGLPQGWDKVLLKENEMPPEGSIEMRINLKIFPEETPLTSVTVTPEMQIQDVLKLICWKMKFNAPEYTLALSGGVEALEMDRTVADLEGKQELVMVKRRTSVLLNNPGQ